MASFLHMPRQPLGKMDGEAIESQPKQERLRTRWTASLDKIFADLVVEQIQLGNRPNNIFDRKTWNHIRNEFNRQTDLNFNNNQLRKHLDVLRSRFYNLKSAFAQNDFPIDDCCVGFDLWEDSRTQPKPETKIRDCPIYGQLCTIFADSGADGKYAQSSHYEELDKSTGPNPPNSTSCAESGNLSPKTLSSSRLQRGNNSSAQNASKNAAVGVKRERPSEAGSCSGQSNRDQEINDAMAQALLEIIAASKLRTVVMPQIDERFTISNCIEVLDEMIGIDDYLYYSALDLFEDSDMREMFISLKNNEIRLTWLRGKCGIAPLFSF